MRGWQQTLWMGTLLGVLLFWPGQLAAAQAAIPNSAITGELRSLASHSALVFVGQITSIQRRTGVVDVAFRVEQTVSGAAAGTYVMHEWAGLWPPGHLRYVVGQRVLAFVYGASAAGLNGPVHGAEGLVPVVVQGANAPRLLDVRRLAAAVVRAPGTPLPSERDGAIPLNDAIASFTQAATGTHSEFTRLPIPITAHPPAAMQPDHGAGGFIAPPVHTAEAPVRAALTLEGPRHETR